MTPAEFKWLARRYQAIKADAARDGRGPEWIVQQIFGECHKIGVPSIEFARAAVINLPL